MEFDEEEIHRIRVALAERRSKMTKEEARADHITRVNEVLWRIGKEPLSARKELCAR
ncbi:hypothetical protein FACS1894139_11300 [Planctomycetales bacterium]|nr:hypothetical protein FACS1894107_09750 [Planctomycetales bacterium]GHS98375.1 hypothetical protein FACS1894108_06420 [Planctomycetales bacterium]GHT06138.1 hypothetical protein FACS1894139_11300 [Planctomycetales bacterium]GHV20794.1 hypothetical protein AGMMS49959_08850 [Planctomycetales bacterium]